MTNAQVESEARVGDRLETHGIRGQHARRGEIVEVIGEAGHRRYRVRWEDGHESIVFPADGVSVVRAGEAPREGA